MKLLSNDSQYQHISQSSKQAFCPCTLGPTLYTYNYMHLLGFLSQIYMKCMIDGWRRLSLMFISAGVMGHSHASVSYVMKHHDLDRLSVNMWADECFRFNIPLFTVVSRESVH